MRYLLTAFIVIPIIEMFVLIEVGGLIGAIPTIALVVLTATAGVWLLRLEGVATMRRVQEKLSRGELPETEVLEGAMLLVGGALLLTPGFITDALGFVCLVPPLRRPVARWLLGRVSLIRPGFGTAQRGDEHTIDGEFTVFTQAPRPPARNLDDRGPPDTTP